MLYKSDNHCELPQRNHNPALSQLQHDGKVGLGGGIDLTTWSQAISIVLKLSLAASQDVDYNHQINNRRGRRHVRHWMKVAWGNS